jgi:hypothetical protein
MVQILCTHKCKLKKDNLKLFIEWREGEIKENGGRGEFKYDIFCNATMYPYPAQQ